MKSINLYKPVTMTAGVCQVSGCEDYRMAKFEEIPIWDPEDFRMRDVLHRPHCLQGFWMPVGWWLRGMWMSLSVALGDVERKRELQRQFETLIATHSALISRICFSYAIDGEDYKDLRQDVLINIWKGIATFRGDASSLTWVYRVTLNTCVSTVRKRSRRPATERLDIIPFDIPEEKEDEGLRERFETLHRLISELSPIDKAIVTMWLDERSYDEIAEVVGMSKNNIGLRLHRIKERWRKQSKIS